MQSRTIDFRDNKKQPLPIKGEAYRLCPWCKNKIKAFSVGKTHCPLCGKVIRISVEKQYIHINKSVIRRCSVCGIELTDDNHSKKTLCNNPECLMKRNRVCSDDCFNCPYDDCRMPEHML